MSAEIRARKHPAMTPFKVDVSQAVLDFIRAKVRAYEWHDAARRPRGKLGIRRQSRFMKDLCAYWPTATTGANGKGDQRVPAVHREGRRHRHSFLSCGGFRPVAETADPQPWLAGFGVEFLHIIDKLAHPEKHGGDVKDAFTVVVPSLPGYGFSGKPKRPIGPRTTARLFDKLMTDVVELPDYIAQGGDWGSSISAHMGYEGKGCALSLEHDGLGFAWRRARDGAGEGIRRQGRGVVPGGRRVLPRTDDQARHCPTR